MLKQDLILIGGGGHCRAVIDVVEAQDLYRIAGILDATDKAGTEICGYQVLGSDAEIPSLVSRGCTFLVTVGQVKHVTARERIFGTLASAKANIATVISPTAVKSRSASIGAGSVIMHHAIVNAGATIGMNSIINTAAIIEHDASVGNHTHISTAAVVNGGCHVGSRCFIGSNSVLFHNVTVADNCMVGAGSIVTRSIFDAGSTYFGSPARKIKR
jgi:sugar O-acyltransferase (sialic acid O-acetyltransferase NeuD family)